MPSQLRYKEIDRSYDHRFGITSAAFSTGGNLLATGGEDGTVCVWEVKTRTLLHAYKNRVPVLSLAWASNVEESIVMAFQNGNVATLSLSPDKLNLNGFRAHNSAVELVVIRGKLVATASRDEVRIWEWRPLAAWQLVLGLSGPAKTSENVSTEVLVVGLHWTSWSTYPSVLMVCYQNHGILLYDAASWKLIHTVRVRDPIARTDLSPGGDYLALYSLLRGVEVRSVEDGTLRCAFPADSGVKRLLPVLFVHGGEAIVVGTTTGNVSIWHLESSQKIQDLRHDGNDKVLALAADYDYRTDRFMIVTGTFGARSKATLRWWMAVEAAPENRPSETDFPSPNRAWMQPVPLLTMVFATAVVLFTLLAFAPDPMAFI